MDNNFEYLYDQLTTLTPKQQIALEALLDGKTHREAAESAKCCRETVTEWANNHPAFRSVLHHARLAAFNESRERRSKIRAALEQRVLHEIESDLLSLDQLLAVAKAIPSADMPVVPAPVANSEVEIATHVTDMLLNRPEVLAFLLRRSLADEFIECSSLGRDIEAEVTSMQLMSRVPPEHEGR